jgi:hypothetical protein
MFCPGADWAKHRHIAEKAFITLKKNSIPPKIYLKSLAILEKSLISLKNN